METTTVPPRQPAEPQSTADAMGALEQALAHFETVLQELEGRIHAGTSAQLSKDDLASLKSTITGVLERLDAALRQLATQYQGLSSETGRLTAIAERLDVRMKELATTIDEIETAPPPAPPAPPEPQFSPNGQAIRVVLAGVPGFQGLMEAQRALSGLAAAEGASVVAYKNGEAALEVTLRAPVTAREIVEGLAELTGHQLLIEEARPEAARLRLRFVA